MSTCDDIVLEVWHLNTEGVHIESSCLNAIMFHKEDKQVKERQSTEGKHFTLPYKAYDKT